MAVDLVQQLKRAKLRELLSIAEPDEDVQESRIRVLERNIGLPLRFVMLLLLLYYLFFSSNWDVIPEREFALRIVQRSFLVYLVANVGVGSLLLGMAQVPLHVTRWLVFAIAAADALFFSSLTLITGGWDSAVYWVLLVLVVRNAFVIPVVLPQVVLNLLVAGSYLAASLVDLPLSRLEYEKFFIDLPVSMQSCVVRTLLLLLMGACCYGVQVLLDRQRRAEAEAREFVIRQEQLRSAGRLAAEIAHQIKNPLGIINNAAFTLQRNVKEGKGTITQQIKIIREEVERSDRLITELMGYAQLTEGKVEKLGVTEELDRAIDRVFPAAAKFDVEIRRDYASGLPPLWIQRNNLSEIFTNVLQNAREAMNGHGLIQVSARQGDGHSILVTVTDNGPGIPKEQQEKIFEPYYTTKEKGSGLGLAIVKHNVEMYGGRVRVESEPGQGTTFILEFPVRAMMTLHR
jgi:signal transduction histidine kinase